ncbi:MAG: hypothetical protein EXR85_01425 [Xanthomonadales bacterium]|nr:hypothetical protein [Xanthomonadales bacterium]
MQIPRLFSTSRARTVWAACLGLLLLFWAIMMFWLDHEPALFDPVANSARHAQAHGHEVVTGTLRPQP